MVPYRPTALARRWPVVEAWMVPRTCGIIIAAAAPCATRAITSTQGSGASPHASEVIPKAARPAAKESSGSSRSSGGSSASAKAVAAAAAENAREKAWEKVVAGKPLTAFKPYRVSVSFSEGELVHHTKFGDGYVTRVIDKNKVEVMFKEGQRTLAHGMEAPAS